MESLKEKIKDRKNLKKLIEEYGKVELAKKMNVSYKTLDNLCDEWNIVARKLSALERLKNKVKDKDALRIMKYTKALAILTGGKVGYV